MKLFITGTNSFIGTRLSELARQSGHNIFGVDISAPSDSQFHKTDIRDPAIASLIPEDTDALIHLAAVSRDPDCREKPKESFDINIQGTLNLIDAARTKNVGQFVFASTEWVYGNVSNKRKQLEDDAIDITAIHSEYALSKIVGEQVLRLAFNQGFCPTTILRFGIVYGPRTTNWSAVEALLNTVRQGNEVKVGSKKTARKFIHVDDICRGILSVLGRHGLETFNLSGDDLISLEDVILESTSITGRGTDISETSPENVSIRNPDNTKIKSSTSWRPSVNLREGLESILPSILNVAK